MSKALVSDVDGLHEFHAGILSLPLGLKMEGVFENSYFATFPRAWALIILGIDACSISHAVYNVFLNKLD